MQQITKQSVKIVNNKPTIMLSLVGADDVKQGRGTKNGNGAKYTKYAQAISPHVGWLQGQISNSEDGVIRVRIKDISEVLGGDFKKKHDTSIYWGLKYVLFFRDIIVDSGTTNKKEKVLVMRARREGDKLPPSLDKKSEAKVTKLEVVPDAKPEAPKTEPVVKQDDAPKPKVDKGRLITAMRLQPEIESEIEGESVQA